MGGRGPRPAGRWLEEAGDTCVTLEGRHGKSDAGPSGPAGPPRPRSPAPLPAVDAEGHAPRPGLAGHCPPPAPLAASASGKFCLCSRLRGPLPRAAASGRGVSSGESAHRGQHEGRVGTCGLTGASRAKCRLKHGAQRRLRRPRAASGGGGLRPYTRGCPWARRARPCCAAPRPLGRSLAPSPSRRHRGSSARRAWARRVLPARRGASSGAQGRRGPGDGSVGGRSRPHGAGQTGPGPRGRFRNMLLVPRLTSAPRSPLARTHVSQRSKPPTSALLSRSRGPARPPRPLSSSIHGGAGRTGSRPRCHPQSQQRRSLLVTHSIERRSRKVPDREWGPAEGSDPVSGAFRARLARSPGPGMQQS